MLNTSQLNKLINDTYQNKSLFAFCFVIFDCLFKIINYFYLKILILYVVILIIYKYKI
jgi:hypothetical protein